MRERTDAVTFKGNPLTLIGEELKTGEQAPDFTALDNELNPVSLSDLKGKVVLISSVPSIDTPVCDTQTRRFNEEAAAMGDGVAILTLSMDLPFAQARWCGAAGVGAVRLLSDHRDGAFGEAFGLLIKELRLLARAVIVIDRGGAVGYIQIVKEITEQPDYDAALDAVKKFLDKGEQS